MAMRAAGAILLCFPGAFNMTTGPAHWELLQRARAVDNQVKAGGRVGCMGNETEGGGDGGCADLQ